MTSRMKTLGALLAVGLLAVACGSSSKNASSGETKSAAGSASPVATSNGPGSGKKSPYLLGFITSQTGSASSSYVGSVRGAEARIDALNATGGINGHPISLVRYDDESTPAGNATASQLLIQKHVLGVLDISSFAFGGAPSLTKAGIPVAGASIDGPEWGLSNNMFSVIPPTETPIGGRSYTYTDLINFYRLVGIKRLAQVGYEIPSVTDAAAQTFQLAGHLGISKCYNNDTISFGANDFTSVVLAIKSAGCDGVYVPMLLTSEIAIAQELKSTGAKAKLISPSVAYDDNVLSDPSALSALSGDYTAAEVDLTKPTAASQVMLANLKKYTGYSSKIANLNTVFSYLAADVLIKGIEMAGTNPTTTSSIISSLRTVTGYNGEGILPGTVNFKGWGTPAMFPRTACEPVFQITTTGYTELNGGKPICGSLTSTKA